MAIRPIDMPSRTGARAPLLLLLALALATATACRDKTPQDRVRVSGHVEADDVQIAPEVAGRVLELRVAEGDRVNKGDLIARLDTRDTELALARAHADRDQADARRARHLRQVHGGELARPDQADAKRVVFSLEELGVQVHAALS